MDAGVAVEIKQIAVLWLALSNLTVTGKVRLGACVHVWVVVVGDGGGGEHQMCFECQQGSLLLNTHHVGLSKRLFVQRSNVQKVTPCEQSKVGFTVECAGVR